MSVLPTPSGRRRTERRMLPPFGNGVKPNALSKLLKNMLEECRFSPFPHRSEKESPYYLEDADADRQYEPQFVFKLNGIDEVAKHLSLSADQLALGVSVRSRQLKMYKAVASWPVADAPPRWSPEASDMESVQTRGPLEFVLAVRVVADAPMLEAHGLGRGKVLCRQDFAIRKRVHATAFPFSWREFGGDTGYPAELLWAIKWHNETDEDRFSHPISEVLTVYMNKAAEERLSRMNAATAKDDLAWKMLAAEIIVQIWSDVLRGVSVDPDPSDNETLVGQVYGKLANASGKPYANIRDLGTEEGLTELRSHIAKIVGVVA